MKDAPRTLAAALVVLALVVLPFALSNAYYINVSSQILLFAVMALALNVLVGYAGLVSLGHEHQIVDVTADATENAEDELQENGRLEHPAVDAMREIIEVACVVAFVLELRSLAFAHGPAGRLWRRARLRRCHIQYR